jgi:hypothetical protein
MNDYPIFFVGQAPTRLAEQAVKPKSERAEPQKIHQFLAAVGPHSAA